MVNDRFIEQKYFRDVSRYMKEHNILGSSRGYLERVVASYEAVKVHMVRKYFLSTLKFAKLYMERETAYTVNTRMKELRKGHRGAYKDILFQIEN